MAAEVDSSLQLTTQRGPSSDSTRSRGSNARIPALSEESSRAAPNRSVNGAENMSIQCSITDWDPFPHNMENNADKNAQRSLTLSIQRLTWWWETGAMILSLTCAALIVAVLIAMNGKPLRDWRLPIQINSLISVFATIAKSALLLIFAEALSQLKWNHLETSGGTLDQLQAFDSASRGPWGSFVFAVKMRKANFRILATVGATLTVLATAFEPFAQQVIEFPSRVVVMENETAYVRVAEAFYMSSEMGDNEGPQLAMARGIMGLLSNPSARGHLHAYCPTGECEFPSQWSLGACRSCTDDVIEASDMNCYYNVKYFPVYTIFSTLEEFKAATLEGKLNASALLNNNTRAYCIDSGLDVRGDEKVGDECTFYAGLARFDITQPFEGSYYSDYDDKDPEEFVSTEIASVHHFRMESPFPAVEDLANWQGLTFRRRRCQILFCAKHHTNTSISRGEFTSQEHSIDLKFSRACDNEDCEYSNGITHEGDSPIFRVNTKARAKFGVALAEVMRGIIVMPLSLSYLKQTTIEEFADMVCTVVDSFLKSEHNRNSTTIRGSALGSETYIHVRWQWVVYPLSVVLASAVFLVLTIFESRRKEQRYKSSVLAGYFNRLVGFDNDEIKEIERRALDQKSKKETFHNLERMAAELPVKLRRNSEGEIELVKI